MKSKFIDMAAVVAAVVVVTGCSKSPTVSFAGDVKPVLDLYCKECHVPGGDGMEKSGFSVESYETVMKGTTLGPMVVPGDPLSSNLYRMVAREVDKSIRMPHGKSTLSIEERALIKTWIAEGAPNN